MSFSYRFSCSLDLLPLPCAASPSCLQPLPWAALQGTHTSYSCLLDHRYIHAHLHAYPYRAIHVPRYDPSLWSNPIGTGNSGLTRTLSPTALHCMHCMRSHTCTLVLSHKHSHGHTHPPNHAAPPLSRKVGTLLAGDALPGLGVASPNSIHPQVAAGPRPWNLRSPCFPPPLSGCSTPPQVIRPGSAQPSLFPALRFGGWGDGERRVEVGEIK